MTLQPTTLPRARTISAILKGEEFSLLGIILELLPIQPGDSHLFDLNPTLCRLLAFERYYGKKAQEYDSRRVTIHTEKFKTPTDRAMAISLLESRIRNAKRKSRNAKIVFDILLGEAYKLPSNGVVSIRQGFQVVLVAKE